MAYVIFSPVEVIARNGEDAAESGAKLWFRLYDTTTPVTVYQDPDGTVPHPNPVVASATGAWPEIYWDNTVRTRVIKTGPSALNPNTPDWEVLDIGPVEGGQDSQVFYDRAAVGEAIIDPEITSIIIQRYNETSPAVSAVYKEVANTGALTTDQVYSDSATRRWQYIPGPTGYDARAFGWVGDGLTDDTDAAQRVVSLFGYRTTSRTGEIHFPGVGIITRPIVIPGGNGGAVKLRGDSAGTRAGAVGSAFSWAGSGFKSMLVFYGSNTGGLDGLALSGSTTGLTANGLVNMCHVMADNTINTTLSTAVSAGASVIATPVSMSNIAVGTALGIGGNNGTFEVVYVTAVTGTTFTARFQFAHAAGEQVGGSAGSSGWSARNFALTVPAGAESAGILFGNNTGGPTVQVSETSLDNVTGVGILNPGDAYAAFRYITGGNVKNHRISRCGSNGTAVGVAAEQVSSGVDIDNLTTANHTDVVVLCNGSNLIMNSVQFEGVAQFLRGNNGANAYSATMINCSYEGEAPATDDLVIDYGGSLIMSGCYFRNNRTPTAKPVIKVSDVPGFYATGTHPSSFSSTGCYYHNALSLAEVLIDGSNNVVDFGSYMVARKVRLFSMGDYSNYGNFTNLTGHLSALNASLSKDGAPAGVTIDVMGELNATYWKVTIPVAAVQIGALTNDITIATVPARTRIVSAVLDVTTPFTGSAGTVTAKLGTSTGGDELVLAGDVKTGTAQFGTTDAQLGAGLARATAVNGGLWSWAGGTLKVRFTSGSGNLSTVTAGSLSVYIGVQRLG